MALSQSTSGSTTNIIGLNDSTIYGSINQSAGTLQFTLNDGFWYMGSSGSTITGSSSKVYLFNSDITGGVLYSNSGAVVTALFCNFYQYPAGTPPAISTNAGSGTALFGSIYSSDATAVTPTASTSTRLTALT